MFLYTSRSTSGDQSAAFKGFDIDLENVKAVRPMTDPAFTGFIVIRYIEITHISVQPKIYIIIISRYWHQKSLQYSVC